MMINRIFLSAFLFLLSGAEYCYSQVTFTSSDLPIIVINTNGQAIPDDPKITAQMGLIYNGPGLRNNITDPYNGYNGKIGIEIRGHSSQMFDKKQYGIELRDDAGGDIKASLLGMPEEGDWVLNASYTDKSLMRNLLAYKLFNDLGRYASRTRFCEVVLNGNYIGIYLLQEKIKRDKNRVNVKKMSVADLSGDPVTGGYIIKIDRVDYGDAYWTSSFPASSLYGTNPVNYVFEYPKAADLALQQKNYIKNYIDRFETIMHSPVYKDPFAGYYDLIDLDSFVDYFLLNEFTKNTDAYRLSTFLFKNRDSEGGKLNMGPVWDYDISFGLADYDEGYDPAGWQALKKNSGEWNSPFWIPGLLADPVFKNRLAKRWAEVKTNNYNMQSINSFINENVNLTAEARARNFTKWNKLFNPSEYTWPNKNRFTNYDQEITYLKNWIAQRISWLNSNLSADYSDVTWLEPVLASFNFEIGKEKRVPLSLFVENSKNISSVNFVSASPDCKVEFKNDSLSVTMLKAGSYSFKGTGIKDNTVVSVSPEYKISAGVTGVGNDLYRIPAAFELYQNYPNPFNPETVISYSLPKAGHVSLKIYDMLGREVATLVDKYQTPGKYNSQLSILNYQLSSGLYFYTLKSGDFIRTKKMILMK